jgi:hypothetical protein
MWRIKSPYSAPRPALKCCTDTRFMERKFQYQVFALLGCYTAFNVYFSYRCFETAYRSDPNISVNTIQRRVTSQKGEDLIYTASEAWDHAGIRHLFLSYDKIITLVWTQGPMAGRGPQVVSFLWGLKVSRIISHRSDTYGNICGA